MRNERGFALVLTLVVTALMVAVTAELIHQVYVDTTLSRSFRDGQQASLLAESGISGGIKLLQLNLAGQEFSSLSDKWATPFKLDDESGSLEISASEESGKISLNGLVQNNNEFEPITQAALMRLGKRLEIPEDVWSSLADWLDSDDQQRSGGAESPYYQSLKPPYRAHNAKLASLEELSLVKGFTPEIIAKLKPFVTVYSEGGNLGTFSKININTAPLEVIAALDSSIDDRMAEQILEQRRLKPFTQPGDLSRVSGGGTLSSALTGKISFKGSMFRLTSIAQVRDTARTVEAVVRLGGTAADTLSWREF